MSLDKLNKSVTDKIKSFVSVQTIWVEADEIDWEEKTMTAISVSDDLPYYDILLGLDSILIRPKKGATCLIGLIDNNPTTPFLIWANETEEYSIKVENTELKMDNGFLLKKENETLAKLMTDLLQEIQKMKFLTVSGGPTTRLINQPKFKEIENRFKELLKEN